MYAVNVKPCARGLIQFLVDPPSCVQMFEDFICPKN